MSPDGTGTGGSVSRSSLRRGDGQVVPEAEFRSYYGQPVIKEPVWTPEVPWYFFAGGMAGASSVLALAARLAGNAPLARAARLASAAGAVVSPPLLIMDLGVPRRFYNMLRVFKPTSPLNIGSWVLSAFVPAAIGAAGLAETGRLPRLQRAAETTAAVLGPVMGTYTAVLFANTAVPVWHEAGAELPAVFAGSATASAAAAALLLTPPERAAPARRLALLAATETLVMTKVMERRLGELGEPYHQDRAGRYGRAAKLLTAGGAGVVGALGRRRGGAAVGAAMLLAGSILERWSVFRAGFQSARDPKYIVKPQRERLEARRSAGGGGSAAS